MPESALKAGLVLTYLTLFGFIAVNMRLPWLRIIALGVALNFVVIVANGGLMPVSPETLSEIAPEYSATVLDGNPVPNSKDILLEKRETALWWLSDIFTLPRFLSSWKIAFSAGDVVIIMGLLYLVISAAFGSRWAPSRLKPDYRTEGEKDLVPPANIDRGTLGIP